MLTEQEQEQEEVLDIKNTLIKYEGPKVYGNRFIEDCNNNLITDV